MTPPKPLPTDTRSGPGRVPVRKDTAPPALRSMAEEWLRDSHEWNEYLDKRLGFGTVAPTEWLEAAGMEAYVAFTEALDTWLETLKEGRPPTQYVVAWEARDLDERPQEAQEMTAAEFEAQREMGRHDDTIPARDAPEAAAGDEHRYGEMTTTERPPIEDGIKDMGDDALAETAQDIRAEGKRLLRMAELAEFELVNRMLAKGATKLDTEHWAGTLPPGIPTHDIDDEKMDRLEEFLSEEDWFRVRVPSWHWDQRVLNELAKLGGDVKVVIEGATTSDRGRPKLKLSRK